MKRHVLNIDTGRTWCGKTPTTCTSERLALIKHGSFNWEETDICGNCYNRCNDAHIREARAPEPTQ